MAFAITGLLASGLLAQETTKDEIVRDWKARQERVKSGRFEWTQEQTDTKGVISYWWKAIPRPGNKDIKGDIPPKDTTHTYQCSVVFEGKKLREESRIPSWDRNTNTYTVRSIIAVFDGSTSSRLQDPFPGLKWHQGDIRKEAHHIDFNNLGLQPILMTFRALTPYMRAYDVSRFEVRDTKAVIAKIPCVELWQGNATQVEDRLWVDPARGFVLVRCSQFLQGHLAHQLDVNYKRDGEEWVPSQWTVVFNRGGKLERFYQARVTQYELNVPIPKSDFEIDFPPGTRVTDDKNNREWIVRPDGGKRMLTGKERFSPQDEEIQTEVMQSVPAESSPPRDSRTWWIVATAAVAAAALVLSFFTYRRFTALRRKP
jgi:outer membrane lipoprotein-sorting protein